MRYQCQHELRIALPLPDLDDWSVRAPQQDCIYISCPEASRFLKRVPGFQSAPRDPSPSFDAAARLKRARNLVGECISRAGPWNIRVAEILRLYWDLRCHGWSAALLDNYLLQMATTGKDLMKNLDCSDILLLKSELQSFRARSAVGILRATCPLNGKLHKDLGPRPLNCPGNDLFAELSGWRTAVREESPIAESVHSSKATEQNGLRWVSSGGFQAMPGPDVPCDFGQPKSVPPTLRMSRGGRHDNASEWR